MANFDLLLMESIKDKNTNLFTQAIINCAKFEPKERVYKFGNNEHYDDKWNIIEIAALLGCDESVFDELKKRGATAITKDEYHIHGKSSIDKITQRLVYKGYGSIDENIYDYTRFLKVIFPLFEIGVKPRNYQEGSESDVITADALIRADCTLEQLKIAMEKYQVKLGDTTFITAIKTGWLFKNLEHFKFIQSNQQISNKELNTVLFDLIKHLSSGGRVLDAKKINFDFLLKHDLKLEGNLKHSIFEQCFYSYYWDNQKRSFNDKEIESLVTLVKAGAEIHIKDFVDSFECFNLSKERQTELLFLMIEQLLQKGHKFEDIIKPFVDLVRYRKIDFNSVDANIYNEFLKNLNSSELVKQVLETRTTGSKNLYEYVYSQIISTSESMIKNDLDFYHQRCVKEAGEKVLSYFQRINFVKQLLIEVQARIYFKEGAIYGLTEDSLKEKESQKNLGGFEYSTPIVGQYLNIEDSVNLAMACKNFYEAAKKKKGQFLEKYYTQSDADLEVILGAAGVRELFFIQEDLQQESSSSDQQLLTVEEVQQEPEIGQPQEPIVEEVQPAPDVEQLQEPLAEEAPSPTVNIPEAQSKTSIHNPTVSSGNIHAQNQNGFKQANMQFVSGTKLQQHKKPDQQTDPQELKGIGATVGFFTGLVVGLAIAYLAGATALTPVLAAAGFIAAAVVFAVLGAFIGYGVVRICLESPKVEEFQQQETQLS